MIIVTENIEGKRRVISLKKEDVITDWNGECKYCPNNDAKVFYASDDNDHDIYVGNFGDLMKLITKEEISDATDRNSRIEKIRAKAKNDAEKEKEKELKEERERNEMIQKIKSYSDRIQTLIFLANECITNNVEIPINRSHYDSGLPYGYDAEFLADGICHNLGFIGTTTSIYKDKIRYIGIKNGGACGIWDLYTNGTDTFSFNNKDHFSKAAARTEDMEQFFEQFDLLESAFLKWIDSLA